MSTRKQWEEGIRDSLSGLSSKLDELQDDFRDYCRAPFDDPAPTLSKATWSLGDAYHLGREGWPILKNGSAVAYVCYSGGTDGARRNAEEMVRLLNSAVSEEG